MNKFADFLTRKYLEYQLAQGKPIYVREFAAYLGVSPTTYSNWINSGFTPSTRYVDQIANRLGMEVYDLLGLQRPTPTLPMDQLPVDLQMQLRNFVSEVSASMAGVNPESDEAEAIVKSAMERFGFTFKAKESSSNPGTEKL